MKIRITDQKGKLVKESVVNSMNHYDMLINSLKANIYNVEFVSESRTTNKVIKIGQKSIA